MKAPLPANETERLAALRRYDVLDTPAEAAFDDIVFLASLVCGTPIALLSLIDENRQWFKARVGLEAQETPLDQAFCAHAILRPNETLVVPDVTKDPRFADNQLVIYHPHIRFYAGAPLVTPDGEALGTLCVIDRVPRTLNEEQLKALRVMSRQLGALLELRRTVVEMRRLTAELHEREERFRDLFENATDLIQIVTPDGRFLFANHEWHRTLGYEKEELAGLTMLDIIHPDSHEHCMNLFMRLCSGEKPGTIHANFRAKDGRTIPVEGNVSCRMENGRPVSTRGIFQDITERQRTEAERGRLIRELQAALADVKTLSGMLPVCAWCKKVRDDKGYWENIEGYLKRHTHTTITHGICPECMVKAAADTTKA